MKTILNEGYKKILNLFYTDKTIQIHLRDIARKTKLNENSASRFLNQMQKSNILVSKKDGNMKKYALAKNKTTYSALAVMDVSRFEELPTLRKRAIEYFLLKISEKPIIVFLFGSTAKSNFSENSDIDLLLIVNTKIDTRKAEIFTDAQTAIKISTIQINIDEFLDEIKLKKDKVIQSAINTGYPVSNHIMYYEMMYNERI